jgi:hypothetical protein
MKDVILIWKALPGVVLVISVPGFAWLFAQSIAQFSPTSHTPLPHIVDDAVFDAAIAKVIVPTVAAAFIETFAVCSTSIIKNIESMQTANILTCFAFIGNTSRNTANTAACKAIAAHQAFSEP